MGLDRAATPPLGFARRVFATDRYLAGDEGWTEPDSTMLTDPGRS